MKYWGVDRAGASGYMTTNDRIFLWTAVWCILGGLALMIWLIIRRRASVRPQPWDMALCFVIISAFSLLLADGALADSLGAFTNLSAWLKAHSVTRMVRDLRRDLWIPANSRLPNDRLPRVQEQFRRQQGPLSVNYRQYAYAGRYGVRGRQIHCPQRVCGRCCLLCKRGHRPFLHRDCSRTPGIRPARSSAANVSRRHDQHVVCRCNCDPVGGVRFRHTRSAIWWIL